GGAHHVVERALLVGEVHLDDRLGARRQLRGDLLLEAAQQERADLLAQEGGGVGAPGGDRRGEAALEVGARAEQPRVGEVADAPQLLEAILDRRARQRDAEAGRDRERRLRLLAVRVLDRLRLVEDERRPA